MAETGRHCAAPQSGCAHRYVEQSASFLQAPAVPASLDPGITGNSGSTPSLHIVGSDAGGVRLEVLVPPGALDLSKATTSKGTAPQVPLTIQVTQQSGHFVGMNTSLGTFQVQITDAQLTP